MMGNTKYKVTYPIAYCEFCGELLVPTEWKESDKYDIRTGKKLFVRFRRCPVDDFCTSVKEYGYSDYGWIIVVEQILQMVD